MSWQHRISNINPIRKRAQCAVCGEVEVVFHNSKNVWRCAKAKRDAQREMRRKRGLPAESALFFQRVKEHRKYLKEKCERCGFVPENTCQLEVDHIDENHKNNAPSNLRTLCANCHTLRHRKPALFNWI